MERCIGPEAIPAWQLEAYLDGVAPPAVSAHLAACADCARRLADMRRQDIGLKMALLRVDCPTPDELRGYRWQRLPPERIQIVCEHLAHCRTCSRELAQYAGPEPLPAMSAGETATNLGRRLAQFVARLVPADSGLLPALRGALTEPTLYRIEENGWELLLTQSTEAQGHALSGQFLGPAAGRLAVGYAAAVSAGRLVRESDLDASGWFELHPLAAGRYDLWLEISGARITIPDVEVGTSGGIA
jgi:anti-sigma factor RsiW